MYARRNDALMSSRSKVGCNAGPCTVQVSQRRRGSTSCPFGHQQGKGFVCRYHLSIRIPSLDGCRVSYWLTRSSTLRETSETVDFANVTTAAAFAEQTAAQLQTSQITPSFYWRIPSRSDVTKYLKKQNLSVDGTSALYTKSSHSLCKR